MQKLLTKTMHDLKKQGVGGSYTAVKNLYVTLAFIGETENVSGALEALRSISFKPFRISLSDFGSFGNTLWIGVKGGQGLAGAAKAVQASLEKAGIPYDKAKFVPHITLVRKAAGSWKPVKAPKAEMMAGRISLMKSAAKDGKTQYTEIGSI